MASGALLFVQDSFVSMVVVVIVVVMLYATLRTISESRRRTGHDEQGAAPQPYISSSSDPRGLETHPSAPLRTRPALVTAPADPDDTRSVDMTLYDPEAYDETPRANLAIATYNFLGFDSEVGPRDRDCFYDEIMVEVYDRNTGHRWSTRYFVATPLGIAKLMADERWQAMSGNNHLIVLRYDVKKILDAILRHLNNAWEVPSEQGDLRDRKSVV